MRATRRATLYGLAGSAGTLILGCPPPLDDDDSAPDDDDSAPNDDDSAPNDDDSAGPADPFVGATLLNRVTLGPDATRPMDETYDAGLDGRRYVDLSDLDAQSLVLGNDAFYVRTREPDQIVLDGWILTIDGLVVSAATLDTDELGARSVDQGVHLMECSGNSGAGRFGLLSAARWGGVPASELFDLVTPLPAATHILVEGFDGHSAPSDFSEPGASWIFTRAQLEETGAFFATSMNDAPLPADHGFPVRLLVPGWFGCCCIKWVNRIAFVDADAPSTPQMREFAGRTHQDGIPERAADFAPADIQLAAMPVRVERWRAASGALLYKAVGVMWGGTQTTDRLTIDWGEGPEPVWRYAHSQSATWTLFEHAFLPAAPGTYTITMGVDDPAIPTRRLDSDWYARDVVIPDV